MVEPSQKTLGFEKLLHVIVNPSGLLPGAGLAFALVVGSLGFYRLASTPSGMPPSTRSTSAVLDAVSPYEQPVRIAVPLAGTDPVQLTPELYDSPTSGFCVVPAGSTSLVYVVEENATVTTNGDGPYCADSTTCTHGATIPVAGRAFALASSAVTLSCRFVDAGNGYSSGGPKASGNGGLAPSLACRILGGPDCDMTGQMRGAGGTTAVPGVGVGTDNTGWSYEAATGMSMSVDGNWWFSCKGTDCPVHRQGQTWGSYTPGGATEWSQVWAHNIFSATSSQGLIVNGDYGFKIGSNVAALDIGGSGSGLYSMRSTAPHYFTSQPGDVPGIAGIADTLTGIDFDAGRVGFVVNNGSSSTPKLTATAGAVTGTVPIIGHTAAANTAAAAAAYWKPPVTTGAQAAYDPNIPTCAAPGDVAKTWFFVRDTNDGFSNSPTSIKCECVSPANLGGTYPAAQVYRYAVTSYFLVSGTANTQLETDCGVH